LFVGVVGGGDEEKVVVGAGEDDEFAFLTTTPPGEVTLLKNAASSKASHPASSEAGRFFVAGDGVGSAKNVFAISGHHWSIGIADGFVAGMGR